MIRLDCLFKKLNTILDDKFPFSLSNAICNLLAETKAISMPEKKAENNNEINAMVRRIL